MPLTDTMLRNLKSDGTPAKLADSEGLYLYLSASGGKLWRMDYRYAGKRKTLSFGAYPAVSLKDARRKRDKAKELLANDIDPGAQKKAAKEEAEAAAREQALTFAVVAREWFDTRCRSSAALYRRIPGRSRCRLCAQDSAVSGLAERRTSRRHEDAHCPCRTPAHSGRQTFPRTVSAHRYRRTVLSGTAFSLAMYFRHGAFERYPPNGFQQGRNDHPRFPRHVLHHPE